MLIFILLAACPASAFGQELALYGAGSLRLAMTEIVSGFSKDFGPAVKTEFGPSGLLRSRIEKGERPDVFTSADLEQPGRLTANGLAGPTVVFTRNRLCVVGRKDLGLRTDGLLDLLLDQKVRVGTSTPKSDPSGDYTWEMFRKAETLRPGSFALLDKKAMQVVGGPTNSQPVGGKGAVAVVFDRGDIDLYIGYCTSAKQTADEVSGLIVVDVPQPLQVAASYGLTVLRGAKSGAADLAMYILSPKGQAILAKYGFSPVALPGE
jgi:molybdenum ABC transporter molybdate-binding protein